LGKESRWSDDPPPEQLAQLTTLQDLEDWLYSNFEASGFSKALKKVNEDDLLSPQLLGSLKDLWKNWVKKENFFPGFPEPPQKDDKGQLIAIDPGKADRLEALEQEPRYTWNHVFWAGGWNTKANGTGHNGILLPKNWRGQSEGGGFGY
jgi:hypothetical protein